MTCRAPAEVVRLEFAADGSATVRKGGEGEDVWRTTDQGMTWHLSRPPRVHHQIDSSTTPMGFAKCKACGGYVTKEQWAAEQCPGKELLTARPRERLGPVCALCGHPLVVEPVHWAIVEVFGSVCNACAAVALSD